MSANAFTVTATSRRSFLGGAVALGVGLGLAGCTSSPTPSGTGQGGVGSFNGVTVRVAVGSFMSTGVKIFKDAWEAKTGGKVEIVEIPFGDLYSKLFQAFSSRVDAYDVVIYASNWTSGFAKAKYISPLDDFYKAKSNAGEVLEKVQKLSYASGSRYTIPLDGDVIMLYYRKDAFESQEAKDKHKAKYGSELAVPTTWDDYVRLAEFFTGWDWAKNGKECYGVLEAMKPKDVGPYILTAHAAGYAGAADSPLSLFFDPDTMKPQVDNPGWVQALTDWVRLLKSGPSQMITFGGGDQRGNFVAGNYALAIDWPDIGVLAQDSSQSIIQDKLGYAVIPGSKRVWSAKQGTWIESDTVMTTPYMGWGGWHASVAATSPNPAAAWDFADFLDSTENALKAVTTPGTARGPYRKDHFDPAKWTASDVKFVNAEDYLNSQLTMFNDPNVRLDLRIPEAGRYFEALDGAAQQALSGAATPEQALADCAKKWTSITEEIGKESQQQLYRDLQATS